MSTQDTNRRNTSSSAALDLKSRHLNLGCGERFHPEWVNLDLHPANPSVRGWDLQEELPFADGSFDVVYHSHVLEHFSKAEGLRLLQRCCRVLRPKGIIRVAIPDLERIARLYLEALDKSVAGDRAWQNRYDWMLLEMYDQTVRDVSGGEMLTYLNRDPIPEQDFVASRLGGELRRLKTSRPEDTDQGPPRLGLRIRNLASRKIARLALGRKGIQAHDLGAMRISGEVHRWMYDRFSLARALEEAGFSSPRKLGATESSIVDWASFNLDTESDGTVYKPDSLFMEAIRA
jgi:predicted SAM-dependent methyltransferase